MFLWFSFGFYGSLGGFGLELNLCNLFGFQTSRPLQTTNPPASDGLRKDSFGEVDDRGEASAAKRCLLLCHAHFLQPSNHLGFFHRETIVFDSDASPMHPESGPEHLYTCLAQELRKSCRPMARGCTWKSFWVPPKPFLATKPDFGGQSVFSEQEDFFQNTRATFEPFNTQLRNYDYLNMPQCVRS